ncbi:MAG: N-acetylglucosamine-6-phosphate deacetylase, partial [Micrococcaceae bacterium]|nr:N-acetylglucosamine-6-phosphate deacetylase [Micrococcaceae bacterium]
MASETLTLRGRIVTGSRSVDDGLIAVGGDRIVFAGPAAEYGGPGAEGASPAADFGGPAADFAGPAADPVGPAADPSSAIDANVNPAGTTPREYLLLPGLVDLHCHGAGGNDFSEGSPDGARAAAGFLHSRGSTTLLASLVTASQPDLVRNLNALRSLADKGLIAGMHLEGPFLSPEHHGAHDPGLLREPDPLVVGELLEAAGPWLTSVTYAAELRGAVELV